MLAASFQGRINPRALSLANITRERPAIGSPIGDLPVLARTARGVTSPVLRIGHLAVLSIFFTLLAACCQGPSAFSRWCMASRPASPSSPEQKER